jgi:DNA polymerase-3 subunit gamma/tau
VPPTGGSDRPPAAGGEGAATGGPAAASQPVARQTPPRRPAPAERSPEERRRYGESVVREILNASFIEEQKIAPPAARPEF